MPGSNDGARRDGSIIRRAMRPVAMSLVLLLTLSAWAADRQTIRTGLKRIDATYFTFDIPVEMVKTQVKGIDSHVGQYESSQIRLGFDYGSYADPLEYDKRLPQYQASEVKVDGRKARIVSFYQAEGWFTAIHFPKAGPALGEQTKLTMHASCKTAKELHVARNIFTSIRFQ